MTRTLAALVLVLLSLTACGEDEPPPGELSASVVDPPFVIDGTPLTDTSGTPYSLTEDTDARLTLLFFGYTHCPDICSAVLSTVAAGLTRLGEEQREQVDVVFVTTDPARDDEQRIRDYLDQFDPTFEGLTGDLDTVVDLAEDVGIFVADAEQLATGGIDLGAHGTQVLGIDVDDEVPVFWSQSASAADYAADISMLLGEP